MALYLLRMLFERTGGDPRDRTVFGFHVDSNSQPSASTWQTAMAFAWDQTGMNSVIQSPYEASVFQVYDVSAGGPPVDEEAANASLFSTAGAQGPQEVQVCITRWTDDSLGRPRKQGRWYVGPIGAEHMNGQLRPPTALVTTLTAMQQELHAQLVSNGMTPVVVSRTQGVVTGYPITQYSIDDAWDTQRRRGIDPTAETVFPVVAPAP